ncbi:MAG: mismatch repair protein MutS2, partial [Campylobacterota bacterium]|nr:mismatch repair protein MutS2 [Campylobacterota bacterium]
MTVQQPSEKSIIQKLDLDGYILRFKQFFAREKSIVMMGDVNQHYRYIKSLSAALFPPPYNVPNLDRELVRIKKQGVLSLDEIYAFVKILSYFNTLAALDLPEPIFSWIKNIQIPQEMHEIIGYFTDDGQINAECDAELFGLERAIKQNKIQIKETLYKMAHASKLSPYLVDAQIHFNGGEETLLVRGGFNNALKATVVGRSAGGYFYIIPQSISHLKEKEAALLSSKEELIYRYCKKISATFFTWERFISFVNKEYDRFDHY